MFRIAQIEQAHSKVKSGADFPKYIKELKALGVLYYEHYVSDGHIQYNGLEKFTIAAAPKWTAKEISEKADIMQLKHIIAIHQQGQTDYPTFCRQSAEAGVEKWVVDMRRMACIYYDRQGHEMLVEPIPEA